MRLLKPQSTHFDLIAVADDSARDPNVALSLVWAPPPKQIWTLYKRMPRRPPKQMGGGGEPPPGPQAF